MDHAAQIEQAFTTQAEAFEDPSRNQVFTSDARWVFDRLSLERPLAPWFDQAETDEAVRDGIRAALRADVAVQTFASAIASKPA